MTFFANAPWILNGMLLVPALALLLRPAYDDGASPLPIQTSNKEDEKKRRTPASSVQPIAALSTWRAHMMLMTALCILAVDFTIYPRELAKCETFGTGLVSLCRFSKA
jgi:phosphatidylinositol glycan class W